MENRRTKIVATVGPSCSSEQTLREMVVAGSDVLRLNFSHGTHSEHDEAIRLIRHVAAEADLPVAIMQDLQGPRIRTGALREEDGVELRAGQALTIAPGEFEGDARRIATNYDGLARDVRAGDTILLSDGMIELKVTSVEGQEVECEVIAGDVLGERKGMNLPGVDISISSPTEKDLEDLAFGLERGVDYVALSFVRAADDVMRLKAELARHGPEAAEVPVIAKIERPEAVENLGAILEHVDGVMVARGDLGIEMPTESVPGVQKKIIAAANAACVPVITATQMLESMISRRRPTRAEASDVANAILDGTDAVMLSAETAIGRYPVVVVRTMARIAEEAEDLLEARAVGGGAAGRDDVGVRQLALARAACRITEEVGASGVVAFTMTGATARYVSQQRPGFPVYALTPSEATCRRLSLVWGVRPVLFPVFADTDEMIERGEARLLELGCARVGDTMVCVAGASTSTPGGTDMLKIHYFDGKNPYVVGEQTQ